MRRHAYTHIGNFFSVEEGQTKKTPKVLDVEWICDSRDVRRNFTNFSTIENIFELNDEVLAFQNFDWSAGNVIT